MYCKGHLDCEFRCPLILYAEYGTNLTLLRRIAPYIVYVNTTKKWNENM